MADDTLQGGSLVAALNRVAATASAGALNTRTGAFTPAVVVPGPRINPFDTPGPWGRVAVGGVDLGLVRSVGGANKPDEWTVQKGTSSSNATTVWKGVTLAEEIAIEIALFDATSFANYFTVRDTLRPSIGAKPPSFIITNAAINFSGITRVSVKDVETPVWVEAGGYWKGVVKLIEFNPSKPAAAGPADPIKFRAQPSANEAAAAELQRSINDAAKAGS